LCLSITRKFRTLGESLVGGLWIPERTKASKARLMSLSTNAQGAYGTIGTETRIMVEAGS
jgi:hypothetical protein